MWDLGGCSLFCLFVLRQGLATQPTVTSGDSLASVFEVLQLQCAPPCLVQYIRLHVNLHLQLSATCSPDA